MCSGGGSVGVTDERGTMNEGSVGGTSAAGRSPAVLVDLDGTLALRRGRSPFDWDKVGTDAANTPVIEVVQALADAGFAVIVVSGRDAICREDSAKWLRKNLQRPFTLHMRGSGDNRRDEVVKREMWETHIRNKYAVSVAFDDRDRCVALWRSLGIPTLQVADGDF